jgi:hypothetical protein
LLSSAGGAGVFPCSQRSEDSDHGDPTQEDRGDAPSRKIEGVTYRCTRHGKTNAGQKLLPLNRSILLCSLCVRFLCCSNPLVGFNAASLACGLNGVSFPLRAKHVFT